MKLQFRLYRRGSNGRYYAEDSTTGKQESLGTSDKAEATRLLCAKNEAAMQPAFNAQLARTYLAAADAAIGQRTWQDVMDSLVKAKDGLNEATAARYEAAMRQPALASLKALPLLGTRAEHLLDVLESGTVATHVFLRRLHFFALTLGWLPLPVLTPRQWPKVRYKERRGVTWEKHQKLLALESNTERRAFLELLWHVGAAQIDLVSLTAEDIDWTRRTISYFRRKNGQLAALRFGEDMAAILKRLSATGLLFPELSKITSSDRAAWFCKRCEKLKITGISLHSYRYAWAERAKAAGYPERYAQEALGHASAAVHRAYAKKGRVELPPLEEYERDKKVVALPKAA
jgi:integrase